MDKQNEYEKRCKAIHLHKEGYGFNKILQLVQRSKDWLSKWFHRYKEQGFKGLKDKSRASKRIWKKTSEHLVKKILSIGAELESHRTAVLPSPALGQRLSIGSLNKKMS